MNSLSYLKPFSGIWQRNYCPSNGIHFLGLDQDEVDYVGDENCTWRVEDSALNENHAVLLLIDNTTRLSVENICTGQLSIPGDAQIYFQ